MNIKKIIILINQFILALALFNLAGCDEYQKQQSADDNEMIENRQSILRNPRQISRLIPIGVKERMSWATDIHRIMNELNIDQSKENVCSVIAIIDQESSFNANPSVPDLGNKALLTFQTEVPQKFIRQFGSTLGPAVVRYLDFVLKNEPSHDNSFLMQIKKVKTEQDLDLIYRQIFTYIAKQFYVDSLANMATKVMGKDLSEENNPITTIGSMQVSVKYASTHQRDHMSMYELRDYLYTREGGLYYGIHRLMSYPAEYDKKIYRFADYNSGVYSSRNAAFQQQIAELLKIDIRFDGDLLSYDRDGQVQAIAGETETALNQLFAIYDKKMTADKIRTDLSKEKEAEFEQTATYQKVKSIYKQQLSKMPVYAVMPQVVISGPKLKKDHNTNWYASNVNRRFEACMRRSKP